MFGALMGTLNSFQKQVSKDTKLAKTVSKRAEIDARIKEKVQREKEEIDASRGQAEKERKEKEEEDKVRLETETVYSLSSVLYPVDWFVGWKLMVGAVTEFVGFDTGSSFIYTYDSKDLLSAVCPFT
jgi:hypothetical protein